MSECSKSLECENKYLCHIGQCQLTPYSLDLGEEIGEEDFWVHKCKFGFVDNGKCSLLVQEEGENGFIKCNDGERCLYSDERGQSVSYDTCSCGYNSEGQRYCPQGHNKCIIYFKIRQGRMGKPVER
jgi:hypothetical protein